MIREKFPELENRIFHTQRSQVLRVVHLKRFRPRRIRTRKKGSKGFDGGRKKKSPNRSPSKDQELNVVGLSNSRAGSYKRRAPGGAMMSRGESHVQSDCQAKEGALRHPLSES